MILSASTACIYGRETVEDTLRTYSKLGIKQVEVFLNTFCEYEAPYIRELKRIVDGEGMTVTSVHGHAVQYEPQMFAPYLRASSDAFGVFEKVAQAAGILQAGCYVFHGGTHLKKNRLLNLNFDHVGQVTDRAAEILKGYGVKLAYENVHWCWFNTPGFAGKLLSHCKSDNVYFNFDIKQAAQCGMEPLDFLDAMGERVANIHICDFVRREDDTWPVMPFTGEFDFTALRDRLGQMDYDGALVLEVYSNNFGPLDELQASYDSLGAFFGI